MTIREFVINSGAEMIVAIAGNIMRMPGLPKSPQAERIEVVNGVIEASVVKPRELYLPNFYRDYALHRCFRLSKSNFMRKERQIKTQI